MSKSLGSIKGLKEVPKDSVFESEYIPCELFIQSFYGGIRRGRCLQFTIPNDKQAPYSHIQLTTDGIEELRKILNDWDNQYKEEGGI